MYFSGYLMHMISIYFVNIMTIKYEDFNHIQKKTILEEPNINRRGEKYSTSICPSGHQ